MNETRSARKIPQNSPRQRWREPRLAWKKAVLGAAMLAFGFCASIPLAPASELAGRQSASQTTGATEAGSGLAIPRFVSLASDKVNVRVGPGTHYPISWQFVRRGLPVEVIGEFEFWRQIRDREGAEGWVHKSLLSGKRTALILGGQPAVLYREPGPDAGVIARAKAGAQVRLLSCKEAWCRIEVSGQKGYVLRQELWGAYPDEAIE